MAKVIPTIQSRMFRHEIVLTYVPGKEDVKLYRLVLKLRKPIKGNDLMYSSLNEGQSVYQLPPGFKPKDFTEILFLQNGKTKN